MDLWIPVALGMVTALGAAPWLEGWWAPLLLASWASGWWLVRPAFTRKLGLALLGAALGWLTVSTLPEGPALEGRLSARGVIAGTPQGREADVRLRQVTIVGGEPTAVRGRVRVRFPERAPMVGTQVLLWGRGSAHHARVLPGDPDPVRSVRRSRIRTHVRVDDWRLLGGSRPIDDPFAELSHGGVLRALATGDRSEVPAETWQLLRHTGTAHLLAISGFHVGLVGLAFGGTVALLIRALGLLRPAGLPTWPAFAIGVLASITYALTAGAPVSAQRAAAMGSFAALGRVSGRPLEPLGFLAVAAVLILAFDPAALGTASFQLSFGALIGLLRVTPWLERWLPPDLPRPLAWAGRGVGATLGATAGTFPAACWWFQELAILAPVANLLALPWVALVVVPSALLTQWAPAPVANWAALAGDGAVSVLVGVLEPLALAPLRPALSGSLSVVAATALLLPRRWAVLPLGVVLFQLLYRRTPEALVVTFLAVGQGDASLVEHPDGRTWLIDGGPPSDQVARYLRRRGIRHLDRMVASHGHLDHTGGLLPVLRDLHVDELWIPEPEGMEALIETAWKQGTPIRMAPSAALHPGPDFTGAGLNDRSLVLTAEHDAQAVLFAGDVEEAGEAAILPRLPDRIAILKVPHHGSRTSSGMGLLACSSPAMAVIGVGRHNHFGHPHPSVVRRYQAQGIPLWRTDRQGTIEVTVASDGLSVRSWKAGRGWSAEEELSLAPRSTSPRQSKCATMKEGRLAQGG